MKVLLLVRCEEDWIGELATGTAWSSRREAVMLLLWSVLFAAGGTQWQMFPHNCLDTTGGCGGHGRAGWLAVSSLHTSGESSQPTINGYTTH